MTLDEIVRQIEAEGFQWAVCREAGGDYTAHVCEHKDMYIADALADGLCCEDGSTCYRASIRATATLFEKAGARARIAIGLTEKG